MADKNYYLFSYRMLKLYLRHGIVVENDLEGFSIRHSKWFEKHTKFNTQKRKKAENDFERDFYKLLNNFY